MWATPFLLFAVLFFFLKGLFSSAKFFYSNVLLLNFNSSFISWILILSKAHFKHCIIKSFSYLSSRHCLLCIPFPCSSKSVSHQSSNSNTCSIKLQCIGNVMNNFTPKLPRNNSINNSFVFKNTMQQSYDLHSFGEQLISWRNGYLIIPI